VDGRLRLSSRRQDGWIAKSDAVPYEGAVAVFTKKTADDPKDSHAFTARGIVLAAQREPDKARADFDEAIRLEPRATLAYYHRANLAYGRGQYDKALDDYNMVIRLDPEFDWAYHVRGWIYYRKKDYDKALADYDAALRLVPTETVFYRDRGNVAWIRKQYDQALLDYSKSIEMDPKYAEPWLQRGKTYEAKKEYAKALADYEQAVALTSKNSVASYYALPLAVFLAACPDAKLRDGKRALAIAQKTAASSKGPNDLAAVAAAFAELGQFEEAVAWQTMAIAEAPAVESYRERLKLYQDGKPYRLD
jgi:tetratricopeptide (TPR) repeat protein